MSDYQQQLEALIPELTAAKQADDSASVAYKVAETAWKSQESVAKLLDAKTNAKKSLDDLTTRAKDLMRAHRKATGGDLDTPYFTTTSKMLADVEGDTLLVHWLIDNMPHLAKQVMLLNFSKFNTLLDDITERVTDKTTKTETLKLKPSFSAMPVQFVEDTNETIFWTKLAEGAGKADQKEAPAPATNGIELVDAKIIRMQRDSTANSGSPMWRCYTDKGIGFNVFDHKDPDKNSFKLFQEKGFDRPHHNSMTDMKVGDVLDFTPCPIEVQIHKNGKWWNIVSVNRSFHVLAFDGEKPILSSVHTPEEARADAIAWAKRMLDQDIVIVDAETTDASDRAEIVKLSAINKYGAVLLDTLIKPSHAGLETLLTSGASAVNGITPEMLEDAPSYEEVDAQFVDAIRGYDALIAYNAAFDFARLNYMNAQNEIDDTYSLTNENCAMKMYAMFNGEWDKYKIGWKWMKLSDAIQLEGLQMGQAHDPLEDCRMTLALIKHMAAQGEEQLLPSKKFDNIPF